MGATAKCHVLRLLDVVPQHVFATGTDKGVVGVGIEHQDEIGEAVDEAAGEFLLLMKTALHLAALSNVHKRALIAQYAAGIVANGGSGIQTYDGSAISANQGNFFALNHRLTLDLFLDELSLLAVDKNFWNPSFQNFFLGIVAQHAHQGRIDVHNGSVWRGDIDAFLERFKKFSEARFVLAKRGNVAGKNGNAANLVAAHHGVGYAIKKERR